MTTTAWAGRLALLKLGTGSSPFTYATVGGLRTTDVSIETGAIDVTNKDSGGQQVMLPGGGVWKGTISATGIFDSGSTPLKTMLASGNISQAAIQAQVIFGNGDKYTGSWVLSAIKRSGPYAEAETYDITLMSNGVTFTAGP